MLNEKQFITKGINHFKASKLMFDGENYYSRGGLNG